MRLTFNTAVLEIVSGDEKKKKFSLLLAGGEFHPSGGGQPGDSGVLRAEGFFFVVEDTEKHSRGTVVTGEARTGLPTPGMKVEGEVDRKRHTLLSRMHTGEHILTRALEDAYPGVRIQKVNIDPYESTVYLSWDGDLDWDMLFCAEKEGNRIVEENRSVDTQLLPRDEARQLPGIKGLWDRISGDAVRVVQIPGFDTIACSGSHVASTGEVGDLFITGYNGSSPDWEFRFSVDGGPLRQEYSEMSRRLHRLVGCRLHEMDRVVAGFQEDNTRLRKMMEKAAQYFVIPARDHFGEKGTVSTAVMPGISRDLAASAAKKWSEAHPDRILILLLPDQDDSAGSFLVYGGKNTETDLSGLIKESPSLSARGGGRRDWLNGVSPVMCADAWAEVVRLHIEKKRGS